MNMKALVLGLCLLVAPCSVVPASISSAIQITGTIVEPPCFAEVSTNLTLRLHGCSSTMGQEHLAVEAVGPLIKSTAANNYSVRTRPITKDEPHISEYLLIDAAGETIRTGSYVVTINYP
ncbi:hypothetical protein ACIGCM_16745 [Pseudomonas sp. NPDC078700]|uniref:hypothetical protein n=1 Tax=Pseudomonas sp. NPDC078700 TaxID=3364424 RepID=UPI0037C9BA40